MLELPPALEKRRLHALLQLPAMLSAMVQPKAAAVLHSIPRIFSCSLTAMELHVLCAEFCLGALMYIRRDKTVGAALSSRQFDGL